MIRHSSSVGCPAPKTSRPPITRINGGTAVAPARLWPPRSWNVGSGRMMDTDRLKIRRASADDAAALTALAIRSKRHWGYDDSLIELWRDDLTFTPEAIARKTVLVAEHRGRMLGIVGVDTAGPTAELEDLWIEPDVMGRGLGRRLFYEGLDLARAAGARTLSIVSDPNAEEFYLRMGARRVDLVPSRPDGRTLPRLELPITREPG
jgi:N-acetylglutamate synthase-like GNAT family acetyltransferase